jgi:hypothetical protein
LAHIRSVRLAFTIQQGDLAAIRAAKHVYRAAEMKSSDRYLRKSYAMQRMAVAIERAISGATPKEKSRAARWAAAWGLLCDIKTSLPRLKPSDLAPEAPMTGRRADDVETAVPPPFMVDAARSEVLPLAALQPTLPHEAGAEIPGELTPGASPTG